MALDPRWVFESKRFRVERVQRAIGDHMVTRDVVRHPGAVTIIPIVASDQVCLIRNFRVAVNETLIELPAGTLDHDEGPLETARRELIEETGYRAEHFEKLAEFYLSPGILDEKMHLYLATGLTPGAPEREMGEEIENLVVPLTAAIDMIHRGEIRDAKSIIGLMMYARMKK